MTNIEMNTEKKFLDPNYVATRLRDFKDIQKRVVTFSIHKSDNETSNSIYVDFWVGHFKCSTLRISDHIVEYPQSQFVVGEDILTKKKKAQFVRLIEKAIKKAKEKHLDIVIRKVEEREKSVKLP